MVMGNLCVHKGERVRELAENAGCELIYLPPYSPNLNPLKRPSLRSRVFFARL
jgi:transposase